MAKRYYWFKMRSDFFDSIEIKRLKKIPGGDTYIVLYINLLSHSVKTNGCLHFNHFEKTIEEELALILDCDTESINFILKFLYKYNLLTIDGDDYYLLEAVSHIGTESDAAERMRRSRQRKENYQLTGHSTLQITSPTCNNVTAQRNNVTNECNDVTVDNSPSHSCNNVTQRNNVTEYRNDVTKQCNNVTICNNVRDCYTEKEKEIEKEPSIHNTNVNTSISKPVDNFGLPVTNGFESFLKLYPRSQQPDTVYNAFIALVNQGVAISDLIAAAKGYAESVKRDKLDPKFIKMPSNFLEQHIWTQFAPKFQLDCPYCAGEGLIHVSADCTEYCQCKRRNAKFEGSKNIAEIIQRLKSQTHQN